MSRYNNGQSRLDPADPRYRIPQPRPGQLDRAAQRTYDRPFELDTDFDVVDENGDVLVSVHQLPRNIYDGMQLSLRRGTDRLPATVVDIDQFYGLVAVRVSS